MRLPQGSFIYRYAVSARDISFLPSGLSCEASPCHSLSRWASFGAMVRRNSMTVCSAIDRTDTDDCPLTSNRANADILNEIQKLGLQYGPVRVFNAYVGESKLSDTQRAEFLVNGLTLSEIPPVKESDAGIEKRLIGTCIASMANRQVPGLLHDIFFEQ